MISIKVTVIIVQTFHGSRQKTESNINRNTGYGHGGFIPEKK